MGVCNWRLADEKGEFFEEQNVKFAEQGLLVYDPNGEVVDEGSWDVTENVLILKGLTENLESYIGEWQVLECGQEYMKIKRKEEIIALSKVCN